KDDIKPMDKTSEAILALKPVTFHYKDDNKHRPQFGLIAEEVAEVDGNLVALDKEGKPFSVRYDKVDAMLLNEFLKEHKKIETQQATITLLESKEKHKIATIEKQKKDFQSGLAEQKKKVQAVKARLQKVTAIIEASRPTPRVTVNEP